MATEAQKQQLKDALTKLVDERFAGDWTRAFEHYASKSGSAGVVDRSELRELLGDAGFFFTGKWADGIIEAADLDGDEGVSWDEFQALLKRQ